MMRVTSNLIEVYFQVQVQVFFRFAGAVAQVQVHVIGSVHMMGILQPL